MATIQFKRGTRAQLDAAAGNNELHAGEPYLVTDEDAVAIGTGAGDYKDVGASTLGDLTDVDTSGGSTGDVLTQQADGSFALEAAKNTTYTAGDGLDLTGTKFSLKGVPVYVYDSENDADTNLPEGAVGIVVEN